MKIKKQFLTEEHLLFLSQHQHYEINGAIKVTNERSPLGDFFMVTATELTKKDVENILKEIADSLEENNIIDVYVQKENFITDVYKIDKNGGWDSPASTMIEKLPLPELEV